jgi:hypothetical protein
MIFQITVTHIPDAEYPIPTPARDEWEWALVKADGEVITRGPRVFALEKEARSQIAQAKRSMKGAMRCKVVTLDG